MQQVLREDQIRMIVQRSSGRVRHIPIKDEPVFVEDKTGLVFRYVPEGWYMRGLSVDEEKAARVINPTPPLTMESMRPVQQVHVHDMLVGIKPITWHEYLSLAPKTAPYSVSDCKARGVLHSASYRRMEDAAEFCEQFSYRLPSENEWEYFARAGTDTLFFFGNELPDEETLDEILRTEFCPTGENFWGASPKDLLGRIGNPFGIYGLFAGESCSDPYLPTYDAESPGSGHVVRGSGSLFWPWQDCNEWIWCMSSMRISSEKTYEGQECAFRAILPLANGSTRALVV